MQKRKGFTIVETMIAFGLGGALLGLALGVVQHGLGACRRGLDRGDRVRAALLVRENLWRDAAPASAALPDGDVLALNGALDRAPVSYRMAEGGGLVRERDGARKRIEGSGPIDGLDVAVDGGQVRVSLALGSQREALGLALGLHSRLASYRNVLALPLTGTAVR